MYLNKLSQLRPAITITVAADVSRLRLSSSHWTEHSQMLLRRSLNSLARPAFTSLVCHSILFNLHPSIDSLFQRAASTLSAGFPKVAERVRSVRS